jgi:hypothetical protein
MKATKPGRVIGIALESYSGPPDQIGWITVFLNPHFALGTINDNGDFEELFKEIENASTIQSESSTSILEKFLSLIKSALEKLGILIEEGIVKVKEMVIEKLTANITITNQLCVGKVCVDEAKFRELLEKAGVEPIILEESTSTATSTVTTSQETANNEPANNETANNETANNQATSNETMSNEQSGSEQSSTNSFSTSTATSTEETSQEISTSTSEQSGSEQQTTNNQTMNSEQFSTTASSTSSTVTTTASSTE